MSAADVRREMFRRLDDARADLTEAQAGLSISVFDAYQKPARAERLMSEYCMNHGKEALLNELRENPEQFGIRKGHHLTRDGWKDGAPQREVKARQALAEIADRVDAVLGCARRVRTMEEAASPELQELERARQRGRGDDGLQR